MDADESSVMGTLEPFGGYTLAEISAAAGLLLNDPNVGPLLKSWVDHTMDALAEATRLRHLLSNVLGQFHEKGYVGTACIRTGWVSQTTYEQWCEAIR